MTGFVPRLRPGFRTATPLLAAAIVLALAAGPTAASVRAPPAPTRGTAQSNGGSAPATRPLPGSVERVLSHPTLRGARVGLAARIVPDGEVLLGHNADELFAPASVNKIFTVSAALWRLGPHFVWKTPVAHTGSRRGDTIDGDLWVVGRGAPDLVDETLFLAARDIARMGIARVTGDLVVDDRFFDDQRYGEGWPGGRQTREAYHAPVSALMANFAAVRRGNEWVAVEDPALHAGETLEELLELVGVDVGGGVRRPTVEERQAHPAAPEAEPDDGFESLPAGLTRLYLIHSRPLGRIVIDVNKFSNNVMAEVLLKGVGAAEYGPPGTATKGLAVVSRFLSEALGVPLNAYVPVDGSGLSRQSRYSPAQVVALLDYAYDDFHLGPELISSLKLGGLDGWNPRPFKDPPLLGELRLKSGHIRGVNTLAGYAHTDSGETVAFCIMVNEHRSAQWEIDQRMAELSQAILSSF